MVAIINAEGISYVADVFLKIEKTKIEEITMYSLWMYKVDTESKKLLFISSDEMETIKQHTEWDAFLDEEVNTGG
jgi:hypothetical protein